MAFQIKNFTSIVAAMINYMRGTQTTITDFNVGSVARTMLEAPAIEMDEMYQQMFNGIKEGIPIAIYDSFSFSKKSAASAFGIMRLTITSNTIDVMIPANTEFVSSYNLQTYLTTVETTIAAGSTQADINLMAAQSGLSGNIITVSSPFTTAAPIAGLLSAVMLYGFNNGVDQETDDERRLRFINYIASLRGSTLSALDYGLKSDCIIENAYGTVTERVAMTAFIEPYLLDSLQPVGWVQAYIHNGVAGASLDLLAKARLVIDGYMDANGNRVIGYKAAGVKVDIAAATNVSASVTGTASALTGYSNTVVAQAVHDAIYVYLQSLNINTSVTIDNLYATAKAVPGINRFVLTTPTGDIAASPSSKIIAGTITITPV